MKKSINDNGTLKFHKRREDIMDNTTVARPEGSGKRSSFMDEIKEGQRVLKMLEERLESRDPSMRETAEAAVDTLRTLADSIDLAKHVMPVSTGKGENYGKSRKVPRYRMPQKSEEAGAGLSRCPDGVGDKVIVSLMPGSPDNCGGVRSTISPLFFLQLIHSDPSPTGDRLRFWVKYYIGWE